MLSVTLDGGGLSDHRDRSSSGLYVDRRSSRGISLTDDMSSVTLDAGGLSDHRDRTLSGLHVDRRDFLQAEAKENQELAALLEGKVESTDHAPLESRQSSSQAIVANPHTRKGDTACLRTRCISLTDDMLSVTLDAGEISGPLTDRAAGRVALEGPGTVHPQQGVATVIEGMGPREERRAKPVETVALDYFADKAMATRGAARLDAGSGQPESGTGGRVPPPEPPPRRNGAVAVRPPPPPPRRTRAASPRGDASNLAAGPPPESGEPIGELEGNGLHLNGLSAVGRPRSITAEEAESLRAQVGCGVRGCCC